MQVHFWEYMQPGYDALGFISCTGTNFLMRANAFIDVSAALTLPVTRICKLFGGSLRSYCHQGVMRVHLLIPSIVETWS